ncbi:MAG: PDZ domain-containing protein [Nitrososphaeraceae archaeon]
MKNYLLVPAILLVPIMLSWLGSNFTLHQSMYDTYASVEVQLNTSSGENATSSLFSFDGNNDTISNDSHQSAPLDMSNTTQAGAIHENRGYPAGYLQIPYTGLIRNQISPEIAKLMGLNSSTLGMIVAEVLPGSPAEKAGFKAGIITRSVSGNLLRIGGDIILEIDGNKSYVRSNEAYQHYLENVKNVGDNLNFTVLRDGKLDHLTLSIGAVPLYFWYENPDEGIGISYPSDWEVSEENLRIDDIAMFFSPEQSRSAAEVSAAGVFLKILPAGEFGLDTLARQETQGKATTRNLRVNFSELGGLPAYESVFYDYGDSNRTLKILSAFTIKDGKQIYRINFAADPSEYDKYLPIARTMIDSFRFTSIP